MIAFILSRTRRISITFLIFLVPVMTALPGDGYPAEEIILGVATSLTLVEGEESYKAVQLAAAEINGQGGIKVGDKKMTLRIECIDLQDASVEIPVSKAIMRLEKIIREKKVHAITVGPFRSEVLLPSMDIIARHRVPLLGTIAMSAASEAKIMRNPIYKYVFRVGLNSKYLVSYLINIMKFLNDRFGFNKVYIMNQDVAWARASASLMIKLFFEKEGWEVLGLDIFSTGDSDFSSGLMRAKEKGAQIILPIFDMPQSGILVEQWRSMKVPVLLCGFISPMAGPRAWKTFNGKIAGALNVIFELGNVPAAKYEPARTFYRAYKSKYGNEIEAGHGPAPAYESVYVLAEAIEKAGSLNPDAVVAALENTDRLGAMGRIKFHKGHQVIFGKNPEEEALACVIQWTRDGKRRIIYPPSIAEGEIELPVFFK